MVKYYLIIKMRNNSYFKFFNLYDDNAEDSPVIMAVWVLHAVSKQQKG